jgi:asparagine synthase (glutamine-hydrolysing)
MCGIAGIFNIDQSSTSLSILKEMASVIEHRGPDGEGYFYKENIGLAHKRLAILDVSEKGSQPMSSKDGRWTIVFNGCIYNYLELKQELKAKGHYFVSTTDTEVIVEGVARYGVDYFKRFNVCYCGMG